MFINRLKIASLVFSLLLIAGIKAAGQSEYPACVSVASDGTISIKLTASFNKVFTAPDYIGPYTEVPSSEMTVVGQTITFDNNTLLNGNTNAHWFYFDSPTFNDTIANIWLELTKDGDGIADLKWNLPFGSGSNFDDDNVEFVIQWDYPLNSGWTELKKIDLQLDEEIYEYQYIVDICSDSLNFRIILPVKDINGVDCSFLSNRQGGEFEDKTAPSPPEVIAVTIDTAAGHAALIWAAPPEPDVFGYVVAEPVGISHIPIEEIWNPAINYYIDSSTNPDNQFYNYSVAAFDSCPNPEGDFPNHISTFSVPTQHTILLNINFDECDSALVLDWNKYDNWPAGVDRYEVWLSESGGVYNLIAALDSGITTYLYRPVNPNIDYCFLIKAIDGSESRSSLSNIRCKFADFTLLPDSIYLTKVNTDFTDNNKVLLSLFVTPDADVNMQGFRVEAKYPNREFIEIGFMPFVPGQTIYSFEDAEANSINDMIWYRVLEIDICGFGRSYSNVINNIHLEIITDNENAINTLLWNKAVGRAGGILGYNLYRLQNSTGEISSVFAGTDEFQNFFEDDLSEQTDVGGNYCYVVEVIEILDGDTLSNGFSNMDCGLIEARAWIPNAFVIDGSSPTFTPVFAYADLSDYEMNIYNRKGQKIFTTHDKNIGWDGFYKGKPVQQAVYVYIIEFKNGEGKTFIEKGTVTVF